MLRFGKYHATTMPGLHFKLPMVDQVMKVSVEEHGLRLPFGAQSSGENVTPVEGMRQIEEDTLMLTGDLNTASVEWTVAWRVTEPSEYLFRFPRGVKDEFATDLITFVSRTVMNRLVGDYSFDEVIGPKRSDIANEARDDTQRILDAYSCGITITALQMQRVIPPDRVKPAFDKVNAAIQQKQKLENEAESERNKLLPEARASRDKLIREAEGYASRRRAEAQGEIEALLAKYHAYQRAPDVTRQRLYIEAMQDLLVSVKNKTDHRCRSQAVPAALEPGLEGRTAANERSPMACRPDRCVPGPDHSPGPDRLLHGERARAGRALAVRPAGRQPHRARALLQAAADPGSRPAAQDPPGLARHAPVGKTGRRAHRRRQEGRGHRLGRLANHRPCAVRADLADRRQRRVAGQGVRPQHGPRHDHHAQPGRDRPQHQPQDDLHPGSSPRDARRRDAAATARRAEARRQGAGAGHPRLRRSARSPGESVTLGRLKIMDQIKQDAQHALAQDGSKEGQTLGRGIELVDVGLSRIEFVPQVREAAFERAVSLMEAIATKTTSEGEQRKKEIINKTGAEVQKIEGEGKQEANILKGKADADIIDSYAKAIRETGEFYTFIRTLEAYKEALKGDTRLILTTDSSLLRMIKKLEPAKPEPKPSPMASSPPSGPAAGTHDGRRTVATGPSRRPVGS